MDVMKNNANFTAGMLVWVVERDEDGNACETGGYVFLARVGGAMIMSPDIDGCDIDGILAYHIQCTAEDCDTDLCVFPAEDCYVSKDDCKAAFNLEQGGDC